MTPFRTPRRVVFSFLWISAWIFGAITAAITLSSCKRSAAVSAERAAEHVVFLAKAVNTDVEEVKVGLPKGAQLLQDYFLQAEFEDAQAARDLLDRTRSKVQDLRVAKSTFFALVDLKGNVIRSDQEHDALAGKNLRAAFPELERALAGSYLETRGEIAEAAGVRGRGDAQWLAAQPVSAAGQVKGLYVTGWSFSAYAYRLENQLRSQIRSSLQAQDKQPLVYVFVVVDEQVYGAPITPEVNARAIRDQAFSKKPASTAPIQVELELTGRDFGAAYQATPALGKGAGVAVLRSET
jgi:hypothetical protein